jgi:tetratricopeptide (TPR) repeat protein
MADDREAILKYIEAKHPMAIADQFLELLEVQADDTPEKMKESFFRLARRFHPDVLSRFDMDPRDMERGRFVFKKLSEAYNTLTDPKRRAAYTRQNVQQEAPEIHSAEEQAEIFYHKAQLLARRGQHKEAVDFLKRALKIRGDEPRYLLDLGWTIFQDEKRPQRQRQEEAREYFQQVLDKSSDSPQACYYMAMYHRVRNETHEAYEMLRDALMIDPNYTPAKRELRLIRMRVKKEAQQKKNPFYKLKKLFSKD